MFPQSIRRKENLFNSFGLEKLEERRMLSTVPPMVSAVNVSSSAWDSAFVTYLEDEGLGEAGYAVPVGSAAQSEALPWLDLNRIHITFSEDVHVQAADLAISGVVNTQYETDHFIYDPQTRTATWTLTTPIASAEKILLDLDGDGVDPVVDLEGTVLDGDWTDEVSTYNSGNGTAGGDFEFRFNVLEGDTYANDFVDYFDYVYTRTSQGLDVDDASYSPVYDLDGDGLIEISDWQAVLGHLWATLPAGTPAGTSNDAPTTTGFDLVSIADRVNQTRISLDAAFEDQEDLDSNLTYSIASQSNGSLFDSVSIDASTGELVLDPAASGSGRNNIVVVATDSSGLSVSSTVPADLDYDNAAPLIYGYTNAYLGAFVWEVSGFVSDADDIVEGTYVQLTGLFNARVVVAADGSFFYRQILMGTGDYVFASTTDPHGEESGNQPVTYVGLP